MMNRIMETLREEEGATMVEYALMVALIAVVCMVAVSSLGSAAKTKFTSATTNLNAVP